MLTSKAQRILIYEANAKGAGRDNPAIRSIYHLFLAASSLRWVRNNLGA